MMAQMGPMGLIGLMGRQRDPKTVDGEPGTVNCQPLTPTPIWISTNAFLGSPDTPIAARACRPQSP
jgi:hypothetical protein